MEASNVIKQELEFLEQQEKQLEKALELVREHRRELINRFDLNKSCQ